MADSTVLSSSSSDRLYQSSRRHPRTYSHILFQKKSFKKFFGPFPGAPGAYHPHFWIPLPALRNLEFFSRLSNPIYARGEVVEPNLQCHPYCPPDIFKKVLLRHYQSPPPPLSQWSSRTSAARTRYGWPHTTYTELYIWNIISPQHFNLFWIILGTSHPVIFIKY